eukprot:767551-Hanusia_phi.AAC.1
MPQQLILCAPRNHLVWHQVPRPWQGEAGAIGLADEPLDQGAHPAPHAVEAGVLVHRPVGPHLVDLLHIAQNNVQEGVYHGVEVLEALSLVAANLTGIVLAGPTA